MPRRCFFVIVLMLSLCLPKSLWATEQVRLTVKGNVIEVEKGGRNPWKLRYGTAGFKESDEVDETHLAPAGPHRAYFSHGQCLRLIDTDRGIVLGRWLLASVIRGIVPQSENGIAEITTAEPRQNERSTFLFDPSNPPAEAVLHELILENLLPLREVLRLYGGPTDFSSLSSLSRDRARAFLPETREAVRRDPFSPWLSVLLGKLLLDAGEPGADAAFEQAIHLPISYLELLPISGFLESLGVRAAADEAFQLGYRDFLQNGNDPRLVTGIITRLWLYPVDWKRIAPDRRRTVAERLYQLTPYAEGAELAWRQYAAAAPDTRERKLWLDRAAEAHNKSGHVFAAFVLSFDMALLGLAACSIAPWVFVVVLFIRYQRQRHTDRHTATASPSLNTGSRFLRLRNRLALFNVQYWSVAQKVGFVVIFGTVSWFCYGWMGQSFASATLMGAAPITMASGDLSQPSTRQFLHDRLSPTPDRDFLLAFSLQQRGDNEGAAALYRKLPQYAESWNNLGVIWRKQGREAEAINAFQQARQLDSTLAEASLNLGGAASDFWTRIHQQYVPDAPMLAPPPRRVWLNAFTGGPLQRRLAIAALGPLRPWQIHDDLSVTTQAVDMHSVVLAIVKFALFLGLLLFIFPTVPVQQAPGIPGKILGILFPGTAREWGYAGGMVLIVWLYFLLQLTFIHWFGSPYIVTYIATPNVARAYGADASTGQTMALINPGWSSLYLAPTMLFMVNLLVTVPSLRAKVRARFAGPSQS